MTEQLREKEARARESERHFEVELRKCQEAQARVQEMALRLKQKNEQVKEDTKQLERRMAECDALERQLQQWQDELEDGAAIFPREEGGSLVETSYNIS